MKRLTPIKAIRAYCMECGERSYEEVKHCVITNCPLYQYRLGKRPTMPHKMEIEAEVAS